MSFDRPTYQTLLDRILAAIDSKLPGADARLPKSDLNVTSHVQAEVASGLYDYAAWIADQILENTADEDQLEIIAGDFDIYRKQAAFAAGTVIVTRTGSGDVPISDGRVIQIAGIDYRVNGAVTVATAPQAIDVVAVTAGIAGNQAAGLSGTFASPVAGLSVKVVSGEISGGADQESPASLLARLLARKRRPPQGGSPDDYERWAREVPGITRAWVYKATPRAGFITILVVRDGNETGPIPSAEEVAAVQSYLDRPDISPVCAEPIVLAPTPVAHDLVIAIEPNTAEVRAAAALAIRAWYRAESVPGQLGALSRLSSAISAAAGEIKHRIIAPTGDASLTKFQMAVIGSITFQDYE